MEVNIEEAIATYLKLRAKKELIESSINEKVADIKAKMAKLEEYIALCASEQGVQSFKTGKGTAFLQTKDFASVTDWDATLNFIKSQGAYDMLERRVSKNAVRSWIESHKEVPPGVNYGTRIGVSVRKPTKKAED